MADAADMLSVWWLCWAVALWQLIEEELVAACLPPRTPNGEMPQ